MEILFKTRNQKQLEAAEYWIDNDTEQILFGGAKAGGKSFLGACLIFGDALIYPETHYFIARQELIDLRKFTIATIYEVFEAPTSLPG
jgi:phage terminase large subunit